LPLIDSVQRLAYGEGVETEYPFEQELEGVEAVAIERSTINVHQLTRTLYFCNEMQRL
jgi:hypothetical protein